MFRKLGGHIIFILLSLFFCIIFLYLLFLAGIWGGARRFGSRYENWKHDLDPAFSNMSHREIVSAGAAGGMAAAFGAPVGGVLFALEEACSVWSRKTAWRCLLCTATAVFTMSQLLANSSGGGILSLRGIYPLSSRQWLMQLPFVTAVSAGAGLLGAAFNLMRSGMQRLRAARKKHALRLLEAAVVAAITVLTIASSSHYIGRCLDLPESWKSHQVVQWTCPVGQYNDLATGLLGETPFVVRSLLGLGSESEPMNGIDNRLCNLRSPCYYSAQSLAILSFVYLGLMVLSSGLAVPGGLFMPSVIIGGSFGALSGMLLNAVLPPAWDVQPGVYAMVGATATMAAVFRSSISLVVIIVEGTRGIEFLPGILAATIISNFIAHWLHPDGVYESELERDGRVFFLRQEPPGALRWRTAENIMASPVMGLRRVEEVSRVVQVLKSTLHNGFPVYPSAALPGSSPDEQLEGFILRTQLLVLLQERAFCDAQGQYLVPPGNFEEYEAYLDGLMHAAESSCDGLGGAAEMALAVDPLGQTDSGELGEQEVNAAMIPTLETLETLRTLPSLVACLADDTIDRALQSVVDGNTIQGLLTPPAAPNSGNVTPRSRLSGASPRSAAPILYVNLSPFMDRGMVTVRTNTPATSLHKMFVALSLRHLCVVNEAGKMVGIITRKDLDNAAGHGPLRSNKMAPGPTRELSGPVPPRSSSWLSSSLHALLNRITPSPPSSVMGGESPLPHGGAVLGDGSESVGGDVARGQRQPSLSPFDRYESLF